MRYEDLLLAVKEIPTTLAVVLLHAPNERGECGICVGIWNNGTPLPVSVNWPCTTATVVINEVLSNER